jgi:hypothetical protein
VCALLTEVDGSGNFDAIAALSLKWPMLGAPKATTASEQKYGLQEGCLPSAVGANDPVEAGRRRKLNFVDVS